MKFKHILALAAATLSLAAQAASYNQNLISNGGAESGVSGWTAFDGYDLFQSVSYGSNWVLPTQPGPVDRGSKMFTGVGGQSAGFQIIDVSSLTATGAPVEYSLTGWLGGWQSQGDNALLYVSFLDITGHEIGFAAIGPVTPGDRDNQTGLFFREASGVLPVGVAQLQFSLSMERLGGGDNDGYADNLSFVLTSPVPEAGSLAYALAGLGIVGLMARQRRRA